MWQNHETTSPHQEAWRQDQKAHFQRKLDENGKKNRLLGVGILQWSPLQFPPRRSAHQQISSSNVAFQLPSAGGQDASSLCASQLPGYNLPGCFSWLFHMDLRTWNTEVGLGLIVDSNKLNKWNKVTHRCKDKHDWRCCCAYCIILPHVATYCHALFCVL